MAKIRFIAQGSNTLIGGFSNGDVANVGEALAKHLVEEARVARYMDANEPNKPVAKAKKQKTAKAAVPPAPTSVDSAAEESAAAADNETTAGN